MTIDDIKKQIDELSEHNLKLTEENKKLQEKCEKLIESFPDIVESFGFEGASLCNWNYNEYKQKMLDSDEMVEETILSVKKSIREWGEYNTKTTAYVFAEKLFTKTELSPQVKWIILNLLLNKFELCEKEIIGLVINSMLKH